MNDEIDVALREQGRAWRAGQDPSSSVIARARAAADTPSANSVRADSVQAQQRPRGRRRVRIGVVVAALAAIAAVGGRWLAADTSEQRGHPTPADSVGPTAGQPCRVDDLVPHAEVTVQTPQGVTIMLTVTYVGGTACVVPGGGPVVELLTSVGEPVLSGGSSPDAAFTHLTVEPGAQVETRVAWKSWCGSATVSPHSLTADLGDRSTPARIVVDLPALSPPACRSTPTDTAGGVLTSEPVYVVPAPSTAATAGPTEPLPSGSPLPKPTDSSAPTDPPPATLTPPTGEQPPDDPDPGWAKTYPSFVPASSWIINCSGRYYVLAGGSSGGLGDFVVSSFLGVGATDEHRLELPAPPGTGPLTIDSADCAGVHLHDPTGVHLTWTVGANTWEN